MTLNVESSIWISDKTPIKKYGRMLFVDLAGSERLKKSKSVGEMLKETGNINRSLFTLGKVRICIHTRILRIQVQVPRSLLS